jgi:hypothetical protein
MKSVWKHVLFPLAAVLTVSSGAFAQTARTSTTTTSSFRNPAQNFNHPPCDFSDAFYTANGINVTQLNTAPAQRFGVFRKNGPPATGSQANWVNDPTCSTDDPDKKNVRILATTAGYSDDGTTNANQFIFIIAFLTNQSFFTGVANARNIQMVDIISNFEAYAAPKQRLPNGTFAKTPCGTMGTGQQPCFPVTSVATPTLRQNWRFATTAMPWMAATTTIPWASLPVLSTRARSGISAMTCWGRGSSPTFGGRSILPIRVRPALLS